MVWHRIVSELASLQDAAGPGPPGAVVNPICGKQYIGDTCCAAVVFAAEYERTNDKQWRKRADEAVMAARSNMPFRGINEPTWDALGWHDVPESLPATGIAVDAYCDALDRLGLAPDNDHVDELVDFLLRCQTRKRGFTHNAPILGNAAAEVQNASASVLNLLGRLARVKKLEDHPIYARLDATVLRLGQGQSASGFWPYYYPGSRVREALYRLPFNALLRPKRFFSYDSYGDAMHHLMTLYFAAGYFLSLGTRAEAGMLKSGWGWISKRLVHGKHGGLCIDWSADPAPGSPRFANARDTNAYFLILGAMPSLAALGIVERGESETIAGAVLAHIDSNLMSETNRPPCIIPYEGPPEIIRNILPMFEQSVAWKGRLMAEIILAQHKTRPLPNCHLG